jgi:hypothetical protein
VTIAGPPPPVPLLALEEAMAPPTPAVLLALEEAVAPPAPPAPLALEEAVSPLVAELVEPPVVPGSSLHPVVISRGATRAIGTIKQVDDRRMMVYLER